MEKKQQAYEDWKRGMKYKEIAEKYGISLSTVKSWAVRYWKQNEQEKVATTTARKLQPSNEKLQPEKNKGGAPKGNKNHIKHGIYEKMLFEFLSQEEQQFFLQNELDEIEECKKNDKILRLTDIEVYGKNKRVGAKSRWTCGVWCEQIKIKIRRNTKRYGK